uniref:Secreted protein n=1 Tax=Steinernema glaseri TaxID=37863 RepID=A0A1I8A1M0_9BILA
MASNALIRLAVFQLLSLDFTKETYGVFPNVSLICRPAEKGETLVTEEIRKRRLGLFNCFRNGDVRGTKKYLKRSSCRSASSVLKVAKISNQPDSNQRPKDLRQHYSPPLYQLSYGWTIPRRWHLKKRCGVA